MIGHLVDYCGQRNHALTSCLTQQYLMYSKLKDEPMLGTRRGEEMRRECCPGTAHEWRRNDSLDGLTQIKMSTDL